MLRNALSPEDPEKEFAKNSSGWARKLVAIGLLLIGVMGIWGFAAAFILIDPQQPVEPQPVVDAYPDKREDAIERARKAWERFVEAPSFSSRLAEVRDPKRVKPLMEDFHLVRGHPFPMMNRMSSGEAVNIGERRMVFFKVQDFEGRHFPVALEWSGERFLVDWESLSAYGTIDWAEFAESRPRQTQTMRVYLAALPASLKPPIDAQGIWNSFRMEHRDSADTLVAVAVNSLGLEIAEMVEKLRVPVTIEVRWSPDLGQFEIVRLVSRSWSS